MSDRALLRSAFSAALRGVDPARLVRAALPALPLARGGPPPGLFAAGKAAIAMARGVPGARRGRLLVVAPRGGVVPRDLAGATLRAAHPHPDATSLRAARRAFAFFESFREGETILALLSGGASSLLCLPRPGATLSAKRKRIARAIEAGAPIEEINALRIRLSAIKGGRLARATRARVLTLVLSDIVGGRWKIVGSSPTIAPERPADRAFLLADNRTGLRAAAAWLSARGHDVRILPAPLRGSARSQGRRFARLLVRLQRAIARPMIVLAGGETTVAAGPDAGRGGRAQELALAAAIELSGARGIVLLSAGSDGVDGNSRHAGAFADGGTVSRARRAGLAAERFLARHDSASYFSRAGGALDTGATGTNVADWVFAIVRPR